MESLDQLHSQLDSLEDLRTIVKTMKALSAASIRQYERAVIALTDYYRTVERGLYVVLKDMQNPPVPSAHATKPMQLGAIVFGSDHGLCGRFNEEITGYALQQMASVITEPKNRIVLAVGVRVVGGLEQEGQATEEDFLLPGSATQITATVQQILLKLDDWRTQAGIEHVYLYYNRHSGGKGYTPTAIKLLPINLQRFHRLEEQPWPSRSLPTFSMNRDELLSQLLRQYLFVSIFRACAESQASEHASRLAAMQSAQQNLDERFEEVTMVFRRARQNVITAELLDIVSGFEALTT
jgi:F-type H+-transporting ATPase subunit gamma